jgi:4-hydroxyphenylacetate 3-monooxygenase
MGRSPDYKAAFLNTLGANAEFYGQVRRQRAAWHARARRPLLYVNHALVNPPIDRAKPAEQVKDVYITIQKETDAGIYVSGAKVVATNSALTHYNFLGQNMGQEINDPSMVVMFIAPMNTPGIKLICRPSYELAARATGSPWDYPLTSRFDENDAIFVSTTPSSPGRTCSSIAISSGSRGSTPARASPTAFTLQGCTRLAVKLDFIAGPLYKAARATGVESVPRRAGADRRGDRLAQPVLVADRRHGLQSRAVGGRRGAAEHPRLERLSAVRPRPIRPSAPSSRR